MVPLYRIKSIFTILQQTIKQTTTLTRAPTSRSAIVSGDICRVRKPDLIDCYSNLALAHYVLAKYLFYHEQDYVK
jgi:hypothetical protein